MLDSFPRKAIAKRTIVRWNPKLRSWCWIWTGAKSKAGYGQITIKGTVLYIHRLSWEHKNGAIPDDAHIHHKCEDKACWNWDHLENLTPAAHMWEHRELGDIEEYILKRRAENASIRDIAGELNATHTAIRHRLNRINESTEWKTKTRCPRGHLLAGDNVRVYLRSNGYTERVCVTCAKERRKKK